MRLESRDGFAFITLGVAAINMALMANGVETMPSMWVKEVYQDPMLGASVGALTGVAMGGVAGAAYIATKASVKAGISALRAKFHKPQTAPKLTI